MEEGYRTGPALEDHEARERIGTLARTVKSDGRFWLFLFSLQAGLITWIALRVHDAEVDIEQIDPSLVVPAADRHRLTIQQDTALCTRACSSVGLLSSSCEWRSHGRRSCSCSCLHYEDGSGPRGEASAFQTSGQLPQLVFVQESR